MPPPANSVVDIDKLEIQNFLSYGNYQTTVNFADMGQCLITGENGAGKSTLPNAVLWCLFGRTMHKTSPGDDVVNRTHGKDCMGRLFLKNGDIITRTRKMAGRNELMVERGGDTLLSTLSVTKNQQTQLNKLYNLDWSLFTGSSFFTQYNKAWLEMPDQFRKAAIERFLKIDRLTLYADIHKEKKTAIDEHQSRARVKLDGLADTIRSLQGELNEAVSAKEAFEIGRTERHSKALAQAENLQKQANDLQIPDMARTKQIWAAIEHVNAKVREMQATEQRLQLTIRTNEQQAATLSARINHWKAKAGEICIECEQPIPNAHTEAAIEPLIRTLEELQVTITEAKAKKTIIADMIKTSADKVRVSTPKHSVREVQMLSTQQQNLLTAAQRCDEQATHILTDDNPHGAAIARLSAKIVTIQQQTDGLAKELEEHDLLSKHINYLYKAYNDRRKIKSFVIARHIPFLNSRLATYFDKFGLDITFELTESLTIKNTKWSYEWMSGGQRKRADLAFMLAIFDLHWELYGRQCNMIVLDEVDGRLDDNGIEALVGVIRGDLATRVDTILVVSHKPQMMDYFQRHLVIERHGELSSIIN